MAHKHTAYAFASVAKSGIFKKSIVRSECQTKPESLRKFSLVEDFREFVLGEFATHLFRFKNFGRCFCHFSVRSNFFAAYKK